MFLVYETVTLRSSSPNRMRRERQEYNMPVRRARLRRDKQSPTPGSMLMKDLAARGDGDDGEVVWYIQRKRRFQHERVHETLSPSRSRLGLFLRRRFDIPLHLTPHLYLCPFFLTLSPAVRLSRGWTKGACLAPRHASRAAGSSELCEFGARHKSWHYTGYTSHFFIKLFRH